MPNRSISRILLAGVAVVLSACGHPATEEECRLMFDKSVEVEMRELAKADPDAIAKKQEGLRETFHDSLKDCVGKRVTDARIACVRAATTPDQLAECGR